MNRPPLRFPEFDGDWVTKSFKDIGHFYYGKSAPKWSVFADAPTPCIRYGELYTKFNGTIEKIYSHTNIPPDELKFSKGGEVLIPRVGEDPLDFSKASLLTLPNVAIGEMISVFNTQQDGLFIVYYIRSMLNKTFAKFVEGGNVSNLYFSFLEDVLITIPNIEEQKKVAHFLSLLDRKILRLAEKYELLVEYKSGLIQKIFSQEIRFQDDGSNDYPDWIESKIESVFSNSGGTPLESHVHPDGECKFISIGNYQKDGVYFDNGQRISINEKTKPKLLHKNDLVMVLNDKTQAGDIIGSTILIEEDNRYIYNQRSERLTPKNNDIDPKFAWYYLNSKVFRKLVFSVSQGGTQIYVNFPAIKKLIFPLPSVPEQKKIANFLTLIDLKIEKVSAQLEQSKTYKLGLSQKMFI